VTFEEYITQVEQEVEKRGMDKLVNAYLPPVEATAKLIATLTRIGYQHEISASDLAELIVESFKDAADKVYPKQ
jgi:hypothetical protein